MGHFFLSVRAKFAHTTPSSTYMQGDRGPGMYRLLLSQRSVGCLDQFLLDLFLSAQRA